ncbi:hypothetical protein HPB52_007209 [Rhipicephalus sanguineus]|uniref:Protein nlrc3 n=1 Tax=Rhipicephalus sanguineus TaxID=34632 RepID=A0A9D4QDI2_RHISA|nr:hypothetical protein HPB52_007209 [Rhipicephalus sanguineus]
MAEVLRCNNTIEALSLSSNSVSDLGARVLAKTLQESSSLKSLDISNCRLTSDVVSKFVEAVSRNSAIELVRLGHIDIPEDWAPTLPVTEDVCTRLQVTWNTQALEQWAACEAFRFSKACIGWTKDSSCSGSVQWFSAARVNSALLVELVIEYPGRVGAESTQAVVSFIETTRSLKKLILRPFEYNCIFSIAVLKSLARNNSVREAEFHQTLRGHLVVKALAALLLANRTLYRLKFRSDSLPSKAPAMLARALEDNFVFLTLEFEHQHAQHDMRPIMRVLNRNRSLLNRAVECVLDTARDEHSTRALRLLSNTESLLDAVGAASGKVCDGPADDMEPASTGVRSLQSAIKSLDSVRLLTKSESLHDKLKSRGLDLQVSCGIARGEAKCWLRWHLPVLNEVLWKACMQIIEHSPGAFTLSCVQGPDPDVQRTDASLLEGALMVYRLLEYHRCIKRLVLGMSAVLLWHFPSMFGRALENDQGIVEAAGHHVDIGDRWREMLRCGVLACALGKLSPGLDCLDVTQLVLDNAAAECIADGIRKGNLKRLHLCNNMSGRVARRLFAAVNTCDSLTSIHFAGYAMLSRSSAVALVAALKNNRTLRKLRVKFLDDDVLGLILASLKHNNTLQEMMFYFSIDIPRTTLLDGLQALSANSGLKCLELSNVSFIDSCAIAVADVLRGNSALEDLSLSDNLIGDRGASAMAKALERSSSLKRLNMSGCRLTGDVVSKFVEAVSRNSAVECVRLGHVDIPEHWTPTVPLTEDVFARLHVSWNSWAFEQWGACLLREGHRNPRPSLGWTKTADSSGIVEWFYAANGSGASLVELVIECPTVVNAECTEAVVSFLETTHSLRKLIVRPLDHNYVFSAAVMNGLARNKTVCEVKFEQNLRAHQDVKALEALLLANRTLRRLKFRGYVLPGKLPHLLARALDENFVFLTLEFRHYNEKNDLYPVMCALNRNRSLLNRAVECVLDDTRDEESARALCLLCATESLLDAVSNVCDKTRDECQRLIHEAVSRLERPTSDD